jgi:hypothetical protein
MIYGIDNVAEMIRINKYTNLKIYASNPRSKDADPCIHISGASSPDDLAESFMREMSYRSPGNQYWIKLYGPKNETAISETFMIESGKAPAPDDNPASRLSGQVPVLSQNLLDLTSENARLKIENTALQEQVEKLQGEVFDLEDELDALDEEADPLTTSLMQILSGFTKGPAESIAGGNEVMTALMKIKTVSPEAEALLIKLGNLAESNPDQLKGFVTTLNSSL